MEDNLDNLNNNLDENVSSEDTIEFESEKDVDMDDISVEDLSPINETSAFTKPVDPSTRIIDVDNILKESKAAREKKKQVQLDEFDKLKEDLQLAQEQEQGSQIDVRKDTRTVAVDSINGEINKQPTEKKAGVFNQLTYIYEPTLSFDDEVEAARVNVMPKLKRVQVFSIISLFALLGGLIMSGLTLMMNSLSQPIKIVLLVIGGVLFVSALVLSFLLRRKQKKITSEYYGRYFDLLSGYTAQAIGLSNSMTCIDGSMDELLFIQAHLYRTIIGIESANVLEAERRNKSYVGGFLAAALPQIDFEQANKLPKEYFLTNGNPYVEGSENPTVTGSIEISSNDVTMVDLEAVKDNKDKKVQKEENSQLGLYGWFSSYDLRVESNQSLIIYFMGAKEDNRLPDYLSGFKAMKIDGLKKTIVVYAASPSVAGEFFTDANIRLLNDFIIDATCQSGFISINSFGSKLGLNLSNEFTSAPTQPRELGIYTSYYHNTKLVFEFFDNIETITTISSLDEQD